jgi:CDP-diglyceride synthetase
VLLAILMAVRLLPLAFLIGGCWRLWSSHRWVLVVAIIIGAILGIWKSLSNRDEPGIHRPSSTGLPIGATGKDALSAKCNSARASHLESK